MKKRFGFSKHDCFYVHPSDCETLHIILKEAYEEFTEHFDLSSHFQTTEQFCQIINTFIIERNIERISKDTLDFTKAYKH